jgi:hypothetical protein
MAINTIHLFDDPCEDWGNHSPLVSSSVHVITCPKCLEKVRTMTVDKQKTAKMTTGKTDEKSEMTKFFFGK